MDASRKPLSMPQSYAAYAEKHELYELLQTLMGDLCVQKPEDPLQFLVDRLEVPADIVNASKIIINGPPVSGKYSMATLVAERLSTVHIVPQTLVEADDTALGKEARQLVKDKKTIPPQLWAKLILARTLRSDCQQRGWVISGFPSTKAEATELQVIGVHPKHYIVIQLQDSILRERCVGKHVDPRTGDRYHKLYRIPSDPVVLERLVDVSTQALEEFPRRVKEYRQNSPAVDEAYTPFLHVVNGDQPFEDISSEIFKIVPKRLRSDAPRTPHVVLFGEMGAGKSTQAAELASRYGLVNLSCDILLQQAVVSGSAVGRAMKPFLDRNTAVPDELVMKVLKLRMTELDCLAHGWVLHGFPKTAAQAETMERAGLTPDRIIYMHVPKTVTLRRLSERRYDPLTGERYHLTNNEPPEEIRNRLKTHPHDTVEHIEKCLGWQASQIADLIDYYGDRTSVVEASLTQEKVLGALEGRIIFPRHSELEVEVTILEDN